MNFKKYLSTNDKTFTIDMTALVDIAFIIILFLGIVVSLAPVSTIDVELPKASVKAKETKALKISIDKEGNYYINRKKVTDKEIAQYLKQQKKKQLVILADKDVKFERVVHLMDIAKMNGIEEIDIATRSQR